MANTKSAKKAILINERNRKRNRKFLSRLRSFIKKAHLAIEELESLNCDKEKSIKAVQESLKIIDKTVSKGIIHKNKASRKKSSIAKALSLALKKHAG